MIRILKELTSKARKEYRCMLCGCKIGIDQEYIRHTNLYDGIVDDFICHKECFHLAKNIDNISDINDIPVKDEFDEDIFVEFIRSYACEYHYDSSIHNIDLDWQTDNYELVKMIIEEALSK